MIFDIIASKALVGAIPAISVCLMETVMNDPAIVNIANRRAVLAFGGNGSLLCEKGFHGKALAGLHFMRKARLTR